MNWAWKFKIGDQVHFSGQNGAFTGTIEARLMTGGVIHNTPKYSIKVKIWDGGDWLGHNITPLAVEVEEQNS